MRRTAWFLVLLLLLLPLAVTSTPPSIPWDIFDVDGTLVRASGPAADHTVVLVRRDYCDHTRAWCRIKNCDLEETAPYGPFVPTALTTDDGHFSLRLAVCYSSLSDTLAVAAVYPDTTIIGDSFVARDLESTPITKTGHRDVDGFFCDDVEEFEYEVGRIYRLKTATVSVP